jgi:hypothetical protein
LTTDPTGYFGTIATLGQTNLHPQFFQNLPAKRAPKQPRWDITKRVLIQHDTGLTERRACVPQKMKNLSAPVS